MSPSEPTIIELLDKLQSLRSKMLTLAGELQAEQRDAGRACVLASLADTGEAIFAVQSRIVELARRTQQAPAAALAPTRRTRPGASGSPADGFMSSHKDFATR